MNSLKKYLKIGIGICALVLVVMVFFFAQRSGALETGTLKNWRAASVDSRVSAAQILSGTDKDIELLVACVDKMATLDNSGELLIRDAVSLCHTGIRLKENL
ncbi:MAG: hypothetical protein R8M70_03490 [Alphaproteobacteria bacterium]|nr:hypothetical protein [Alphaproteobacteria bacterium]